MPVTQALPDGPFAAGSGTPPQDMADVVAFLTQKGPATDAELRAASVPGIEATTVVGALEELATTKLAAADYSAPPATARARSTTAVSSTSTTLANVPGLSFAVGAGEEWDFEIVLFYDGDAAGDLNVALTGPSGGSLWSMGQGLAVGAGAVTGGQRAEAVVGYGTVSGPFGAIGAGVTVAMRMVGTTTAAASAGTVQMQFAQATTSAVATRVVAFLLTAVRST